ncbi:hypothetical protein RvY_01676 [Ramazzottius varieornatus]|uniref:Uncharacterized protein n=1 Tax=Ramazzottius varieornatus TaxID=947166 RepID=A0A1D1UHZ2_RAMVA|nr:hypothetical protein RvY_01676 [Ramazzottius varieornatus]
MASKPKPSISANEVPANKKQKVHEASDINPGLPSAIFQPSTSSTESTPEATLQLLGIHPYCFDTSLQTSQGKSKTPVQCAATTSFQFLLTTNVSEITAADPPFVDHAGESYTKLADIDPNTPLNPEARFLVSIEEVKKADKKVKTKEWREAIIRDETIEERRTLILRGPPAVIFAKETFEHEILVFKGLQLVEDHLEIIPGKFMWYTDNEFSKHELKEWMDEQLNM